MELYYEGLFVINFSLLFEDYIVIVYNKLLFFFIPAGQSAVLLEKSYT